MMAKLNLGSGWRPLPDYINIDIRPQFKPDIVGDFCDLSKFGDDTIDEIRLDAAYEHIYPHKRAAALREWHRVLKPGGLLAINWIPDFEALLRLYGGPGPTPEFPTFGLEMARRMCHGAASGDEPTLHKDLFTMQKVENELNAAGFQSVYVFGAIYADENPAIVYNICARAYKGDKVCLNG